MKQTQPLPQRSGSRPAVGEANKKSCAIRWTRAASETDRSGMKKLLVLPCRQRCSQKDSERRLRVLVLKGQRNGEKESSGKEKKHEPKQKEQRTGLA